MKNTRKKGFTIVELVIVIAIIAILAAVLIPTFSNIIKKSNLSADKQAVREMNEALAQWEAANGYPEVKDVEQAQMILKVMQILADAGYNTINWQCLTSGYEVYWYRQDNRMILYNANDAAIEYPDEYVGTSTMVDAAHGFFIYNYNHVEAQKFDLSLGSSTGVSGQTSFSASVSKTQNTGLNSNESANLSALNSVVSNASVKGSIASSVGGSSSDNIYVYATREVVSSEIANAYASMQVSAVGTTLNPVILKSNGDLVENLYYIAVVQKEGATLEEIKVAEAQAASYVYTVFDQMTTGKVDDNATIVLAPGTKLDCSEKEWAPCKTFSGYFGTSNDSDPVVISGARLTAATGHSQTVAFNGSSSKYFVTGFFGTIYGDTTIENVRFEDINVNTPATDYVITAEDIGGGLDKNMRNTVGIIGGVTDGWDGTSYNAGNITLRNIEVAASCSIIGRGCAGGLIGYVGSANKDGNGKASTIKLTIEGCKVHATVASTDNTSSSSYGCCGGIVGFFCRSDSFDVLVKNVTFDGKADGFTMVAPLVGDLQYCKAFKVEGNNSFENATLDTNKTAKTVCGIYYGSSKFNGSSANTPITVTGNIAYNSSYKAYKVSHTGKSYKYDNTNRFAQD